MGRRPGGPGGGGRPGPQATLVVAADELEVLVGDEAGGEVRVPGNLPL